MRLMDRDINIINYLEKFGGATIQQVADVYFKNSYDASKKRLKKLKDNAFIKCATHPVLNKKVYYIKKLPSYHSLIINHVCILLKDKIYKVEREFKIGKTKVDALILLKNKQIVILEVDIFNKTSQNKYNSIKSAMDSRGLEFEMLIVGKRKRKISFADYVLVDEIDNIKDVIKSIQYIS